MALGRAHGLTAIERDAPISVIGTGANLNAATENGLKRAADLLDMTVPEVMNRATMAGSIEIGRHPGVVRVTFRAPLEALEARNLAAFAQDLYGL